MAALSYGKRMLKAGLQSIANVTKKRRGISPDEDAKYWCESGLDKDGFQVKYLSDFKGFGVLATTEFKKGAFLLEYVGEKISEEEAEMRERKNPENKMFYYKSSIDGKNYCVDAAATLGHICQFVNDAKEDEANGVMRLRVFNGRERLCLFALRDIIPGQEVTYSYGDDRDLWWRKMKKKEDCRVLKRVFHPTTTAEPSIPTGADRPQQPTESTLGTRNNQSQPPESTTTTVKPTGSTLETPNNREQLTEPTATNNLQLQLTTGSSNNEQQPTEPTTTNDLPLQLLTEATIESTNKEEQPARPTATDNLPPQHPTDNQQQPTELQHPTRSTHETTGNQQQPTEPTTMNLQLQQPTESTLETTNKLPEQPTEPTTSSDNRDVHTPQRLTTTNNQCDRQGQPDLTPSHPRPRLQLLSTPTRPAHDPYTLLSRQLDQISDRFTKKLDDVTTSLNKKLDVLNKRVLAIETGQTEIRGLIDRSLVQSSAVMQPLPPIRQPLPDDLTEENLHGGLPNELRLSIDALRHLHSESTSPGNYAYKLTKKLYPELFGPDNLRLKYSYNGGGKENKIKIKIGLEKTRRDALERYVFYFYPEFRTNSKMFQSSVINFVNEGLRRPTAERKKPEFRKRSMSCTSDLGTLFTDINNSRELTDEPSYIEL